MSGGEWVPPRPRPGRPAALLEAHEGCHGDDNLGSLHQHQVVGRPEAKGRGQDHQLRSVGHDPPAENMVGGRPGPETHSQTSPPSGHDERLQNLGGAFERGSSPLLPLGAGVHLLRVGRPPRRRCSRAFRGCRPPGSPVSPRSGGPAPTGLGPWPLPELLCWTSCVVAPAPYGYYSTRVKYLLIRGQRPPTAHPGRPTEPIARRRGRDVRPQTL